MDEIKTDEKKMLAKIEKEVSFQQLVVIYKD